MDLRVGGRMILHQSLIDTPVGVMRAIASGEAVCSLEFFSPGRMARLDARLARWYVGAEILEGANRVINETSEWLDRYFRGVSADIASLSLDMRGAPFELRVWEALRRIPPGTTTTYGAIAKQLDSPDASRAVGMANGANPIAIIVPCHRVIGSNGTLIGYGGGLEKKSWLLNHERRWAREPALF
jgi:O-6-methylguanine DNA methyltransferase